METFGILELLRMKGFNNPESKTKLVRHTDAESNMDELVRRGWFEAYQACQSKSPFDGADCIISFIGEGGRRARLHGLYSVQGKYSSIKAFPFPPGCPYSEWLPSAHPYRLQKQPGYEAFEDRVVIDCGKAAIAYVQWANYKTDKEVIEILPGGRRVAPFKDYLEFTLTSRELADLYADAGANKEWSSRLKAVAGVYLILATTTGKQYVGSAYGVDGIWGRWAEYAKNGHGGNKLLQKPIEDDPAYPSAFSYSILQILPKSFTKIDVVQREQVYKTKLGSQATGLNAN